MKRMKKIVKRDIYKSNSNPVADNRDPGRADNHKDSDDCSGTAVVYCNQWECYSRFICLEKESDDEKHLDPA